jgi:hypothetical protein
MGQRQDLQVLLEELLGSDKVYFQPPTNTKIEYPCIVYNRDALQVRFADNSPYYHTKRYQVTVIDKNPDSDIPDKVANLRLCLFNRHFTEANLNHDVFTLYF